MSKLPIPERVLEQHIVALGKTGSGKSSKMRVLIEHLLRKRERVTIIDIKGDWWGLKASADGKSDGFPIVIMGGKHADVPLAPGSGRAVAELLNTANFSCLIDLRGWRPSDRTKWYIDFMDATFDKTEGKRYLMIAEVHNFAPKGKVLSPQAGEMLHWSNRLASEGRGLGLTLLADSQRAQKVHNDLLTSCETLIACKMIHPSDRAAVEEWIDGCADATLGKQVIRELAGMKKPDSWVWSPEIDFGPQRVEWPLFQTFDSFKPQEAASSGKLKGWAEVDLDAVKSKLTSLVEEARANDPAELKKQIADLQRQLKTQSKVAAPAIDTEAREAIRRDAAIIKGLQAAIVSARQTFTALRDWQDKASAAAANLMRTTEANFDRATENNAPAATYVHPSLVRVSPPPLPRTRQVDGRAPTRTNGTSEPLPKGEAATLAACIQFPDGLRREQLTVLTGYKRSTRDAYIQRLREKGFVAGDGDLIRATDEGCAALPDATPLPTGVELQDYWFSKLPEGERAILRVLVDRYPNAVARDVLTEETTYKRSTRDAYLQRLASKQLVVEPSRGEVRASQELF